MDWKPGTRATLIEDVVAERDKYGDVRAIVKAGSLVEVVANPGFGVIQVRLVDPKARTKEPLQVNDLQPRAGRPDDPGLRDGLTRRENRRCRSMLQYELLGPAEGGPEPSPELLGTAECRAEPSSGIDWGAAAARSTAIGAARGLGFLDLPAGAQPSRSTASAGKPAEYIVRAAGRGR